MRKICCWTDAAEQKKRRRSKRLPSGQIPMVGIDNGSLRLFGKKSPRFHATTSDAQRVGRPIRKLRPNRQLFLAVTNFRAHTTFLTTNFSSTLTGFLRTHLVSSPFVLIDFFVNRCREGTFLGSKATIPIRSLQSKHDLCGHVEYQKITQYQGGLWWVRDMFFGGDPFNLPSRAVVVYFWRSLL